MSWYNWWNFGYGWKKFELNIFFYLNGDLLKVMNNTKYNEKTSVDAEVKNDWTPIWEK